MTKIWISAMNRFVRPCPVWSTNDGPFRYLVTRVF